VGYLGKKNIKNIIEKLEDSNKCNFIITSY